MNKPFIEVLRSGGVIAHATETCYGFACDVFNKDAIKRLYELKQMGADKPVSILVDSLETAKRFGVFNKEAIKLAQKYWPGPLTIVVKRKRALSAFFNPGIQTVGIRVPGHKLSLKIAKLFKRPITTTSANVSGLPSTYSVSAIKKQFKKEKLKPDFIIDSGKLCKNPPSTIVDCSGKVSKVLRQGSILV